MDPAIRNFAEVEPFGCSLTSFALIYFDFILHLLRYLKRYLKLVPYKTFADIDKSRIPLDRGHYLALLHV